MIGLRQAEASRIARVSRELIRLRIVDGTLAYHLDDHGRRVIDDRSFAIWLASRPPKHPGGRPPKGIK